MNGQFDIAVVGGGAAGIAAAIGAARAGCTTLLLDRAAAAGGTGGFSGLTTVCGLHDDNGNFLNNGFSREFAGALMREDRVSGPTKMGKLFVQLYRPASFQKTASRLLANEPLITARWNTPLKNVVVRKNRIHSLNDVQVGAVVDCSGAAEVGRAAGESVLATDGATQSPAVIFLLENVRHDLNSPLAIAQILSALVRAGLPPVSFMPCCDAGNVSVKFSGQPAAVPQLLEFLQSHVTGFERCRASQTELKVARRAGAMIVGRHLLTGDDVLGGRKFPDAVARNGWPIEQWSADGKQSIRYLSPGAHYEIPARALQATRTNNLFMAGKSLSADVDAVASARVMGCCLATGAAAGVLAASCIKSPRTE
jgi:hypothetical protein